MNLSPVEYFYASAPTGTVSLADTDSAVTALARRGQLLYAVTGGFYDIINKNGTFIRRLSSNDARLVLTDVSDPVRPQVIEKEFAEKLFPYHFATKLNPLGFIDIKLDGDDLFLVGGNRLYHFDITLANDPLLLNNVAFNQTITGLAARDGLVYVAHESGLSIYRVGADRIIRELATFTVAKLGGVPERLHIADRSLWVTVPASNKILEFNLMSGDFDLMRTVATLDGAGNLLTPKDILVRNELLFVSTGATGTVQLYFLDTDTGATPVAELGLAYLIQNGDLSADQLALRGQTLYVAAGQGDLQLFDVTAWLDGRFQASVPLRNYFTVTGNVNTFEIDAEAIYAGTAFAYVESDAGKVPGENPLDAGGPLGGGLNTIINDQLTIIEQTPKPTEFLPAGQTIDVQFNRILEYAQIEEQGDTLFEVYLDGIKVPGFVSQRTNNRGTLLSWRAMDGLQPDKVYEVILSKITSSDSSVLPISSRWLMASNPLQAIGMVTLKSALWAPASVLRPGLKSEMRLFPPVIFWKSRMIGFVSVCPHFRSHQIRTSS